MSEPQELTLPVLGDRLKLLPWIAWGGRHVGQLDDLMLAVKDWAVVPFVPLRPKWEISKASGDMIVGIIEDAPPFVQGLTLAITIEALQVEEFKFGDGTLLKLFLANLPAIIEFIMRQFAPPTHPFTIDAVFVEVAPPKLA